MLCTRCASPIPTGTSFCMNCGADVAISPASSTPPSLDDAGVATLTRLVRQETAGEYEIEREIGRGGMGVVYLATEIQLRRRVAIKVLPPALTFGKGAIERFRREAQTAASLDHPNIIPIYRVGAGGQLMWYSMKLLEGMSLDAVLKEQERLDVDETVAVLDQVADALDYAHQHGVVHRDVKPGNIMLNDHGRVTVTDFGIAKEIQESSLGGSGSVVGTPHYMAPEQYLGVDISGAADQYSLAIVAYRCLGGRVPFDATTAYELLNKHVTQSPPSLREVQPDLPRQAYQAIDRALAKRPEERFATVTEFVNALAGRETAVVVPRPSARRRAALSLGGVVAVAAAGVLVGAMVMDNNTEDSGPMLATTTVRDTLSAADGELGGSTATTDSAAGSEAPAALPVAPPAAPQPRVETAILIIRVTSGWARVYVDGESRGERPVHREELPPGTHTLKFERQGFSPMDTVVTLRPGENVVEVRLTRSGS